MAYMKKLALFGNGGHAREVAAIIGKPVTFFVDSQFSTGMIRSIEEFDPDEYLMMVAVADSFDRMNIVRRLPKNTQYFNFIHSTAILADRNTIVIGNGTFIGPNCVITTNVRIGGHAILNRGVSVGHDCTIRGYFSAMPGAIVSGNCTIGDNVYLGSAAGIRERIEVADGTIIGMGSAVVKDIDEPNGVYGGVPAKRIKTYDPKIYLGRK